MRKNVQRKLVAGLAFLLLLWMGQPATGYGQEADPLYYAYAYGDANGTSEVSEHIWLTDPFPAVVPKQGNFLVSPDQSATVRAEAADGFIFCLAEVKGSKRRATANAKITHTLVPPNQQHVLFEFRRKASESSSQSGKFTIVRAGTVSNPVPTPLYEKPISQIGTRCMQWQEVDAYTHAVLLNGFVSVSTGETPGFKQSNLYVSYKWVFQGQCFEDETHYFDRCGTTYKFCNAPGGIRAVRFKNNTNAYVAGCFYSPGSNDRYLVNDIHRWINYELDPAYPEDITKSQRVDVYDYDPCKDWLTRRSYLTYGDFVNDRDPTTRQLRGLLGKITYNGPPPAGEQALVPPWLEQAGATGSASKSLAAVTVPAMRVFSGPYLSYLRNADGKWFYGLTGSQLQGGLVGQGDTISFQGPGILGGLVEGNAATTAYGAWRVKESTTGKVVFEAASPGVFSGTAESFVILGQPGAVGGEIQYDSKGPWIGCGDAVPGPRLVGRGLSWLWLLLESH